MWHKMAYREDGLLPLPPPGPRHAGPFGFAGCWLPLCPLISSLLNASAHLSFPVGPVS